MKDKDVDRHLKHLLGDPPPDVFKQQVLRASTAEFLYAQRQHSALRKARWTVAAMLIIGVAFLSGRLSAPPKLPDSRNTAPLADSESNSVAVPEELIAWLDAARLFGQLGMEKRMARAVERAGKLLPADAVIAGNQTGHIFATAWSTKQQNKPTKPTHLLGPNLSAENVNQILALTFGE